MIRTIQRTFVASLVILAVTCTPVHAEHRVRVATYNIKFLDADALPNQGNRRTKLRQVIEQLDADVIALQEIDDREALKAIFNEDDWILIIDDDSGDNQDVAVAIRRPFAVLGVNADLDADDENFLFPNSSSNSPFPKRRDVLSVQVQVPDGDGTFFVMVVHAKSRFGGRAMTDPRRESAARLLMHVLERNHDEQDFILLGDFNDNPDDRSLNILETGDPTAVGGAEESPGPFLVNLAESLGAAGHVSHGRSSRDIRNGRIDTIDAGSRLRNNDNRGNNFNTGDILFDQILVPPRLHERYVADSVAVFNGLVAVEGNSRTRASDHLPVSAEFIFSAEDDLPADGVRIVSLLPNPSGADAGNERLTIRNGSSERVNMDGWMLRDRAANEFALSGSLDAGDEQTLQLPAGRLPLNNSGDRVILFDNNGNEQHRVEYTRSQARVGSAVRFP